jgi:hypothetical protein
MRDGPLRPCRLGQCAWVHPPGTAAARPIVSPHAHASITPSPPLTRSPSLRPSPPLALFTGLARPKSTLLLRSSPLTPHPSPLTLDRLPTTPARPTPIPCPPDISPPPPLREISTQSRGSHPCPLLPTPTCQSQLDACTVQCTLLHLPMSCRCLQCLTQPSVPTATPPPDDWAPRAP